MSGPTKGMVAGQPIKTGEMSKEYDQGFDATFGERKRVRGRFVWDDQRKEMVEVGSEWQPSDRPGPVRKSEEEIYGKVTATDGTDLSTKRRHREYMQANGLTMADDYKGESWSKAKAEREAYRNGTSEKLKKANERAVVEAWNRLRKP